MTSGFAPCYWKYLRFPISRSSGHLIVLGQSPAYFLLSRWRPLAPNDILAQVHGNRKTKRHKMNSLADHFLNYWSCKNPLWLPDCKHQSLEPACKPAPEIALSISAGLWGETCVWHQCRSLDVVQRGFAVPSQQFHANELVTMADFKEDQ